MELSFKIEGEQQMSRKLRGIEKELRDWKPAFKKTADELKNIYSREVFDTEGSVIGVKWQPLDSAYASIKARKYPGKGILEATGRMRGSFKTLYKSDMAAIWNSAVYFKYHQSNKPRSKLPRRVMLKLGHQQRELVQKIFHTYFRKKLK